MEVSWLRFAARGTCFAARTNWKRLAYEPAIFGIYPIRALGNGTGTHALGAAKRCTLARMVWVSGRYGRVGGGGGFWGCEECFWGLRD